MNTKLTLSIDKQVIAQAKVAAAEKGMSLSALVEGYLKSMLLRQRKEPVLGDKRHFS
jgi:predicted HicB family RNase H-like nuclease